MAVDKRFRGNGYGKQLLLWALCGACRELMVQIMAGKFDKGNNKELEKI